MAEGGEVGRAPGGWEALLQPLRDRPELGGLAGGMGAFILGAALLVDDYNDFGKDGSERDPPSPHHWLAGAIIMMAGVAATCASGLKLLAELKQKRDKAGAGGA